jgi:hypothetical protein
MLTVGQAGSTVLKPITIWAGVRIHLSITDAQGLLPIGEELAPAAIIGVLTSNGAFRRAKIVARNGGQIDAVVTIPHDQAVKVWATSRTLKFFDSSGQSVTTVHPAAITPAAAAVDHVVPLRVTK